MQATSTRSLEQLVRQQVRRWQALEQRRPAALPSCVALSRLPGSGGAEVGRRVAGALGYTFYGIELVEEIAREHHVQRHLVEGLDERLRDAAERFLGDSFRSGRFRESDYLRGLLHTLTTLSQRGSAVLLGRGSPYVLPPERTLRVLVVADAEVRAERTAATRQLDLSDARHALASEDAERRRFLRYHFKIDPDDASLYDLVVNTGTLGTAAAADLVLRAFEARFPKPESARTQRTQAPFQIQSSA
jgi:cytidylate kinase